MNRNRSRIFAAALVGFSALSLGTAMAEDLTVKATNVTLRDEQSVMGAKVGDLATGTIVTVLERNGKWVKVKSGQLTGWAQEAEIDPTKKKDKGGNDFFKAMSGATGDTNSTELQESAAGKGVGDATGKYATANKLDPKKLDDLVKLRQQIVDSGAVKTFATEAGLK